MPVFKFRDCLLNTVERSLVKDNKHVELTTKTFDVLQLLLEKVGNIVTKDEILGEVWNGNFVEESNLPVHISKLRRALGDTTGNRFIETVQGVGYRFVAPVQVVSEGYWPSNTSFSELEKERSRPHVDSLAVFPLENETNDPGIEYLADGLTESIINRLSATTGLRVIGRNTVFRYKNSQIDPKEMGRLLGVSKAVTGRVRVVGNRIILGVELTDTFDLSQVWGEHYSRDAEDLLAVQEDIVSAIARRVIEPLAGRPTANSLKHEPESYRLYLKGRYFLERHSAEDMYRAIEFLNQSLAIDPSNVCSYAEIVECYRSLYTFDYISYADFLQATRPYLEAIPHDQETIDVVQVMYCDLKMLEWKFDEAAYHCRKALEINPNSLKARLRCSDLLMQSRRYADALEQLEKVMIVDPLSTLIYKRVGRLFYMMGKYSSAVGYLSDALDLDPRDHEALSLRGAVHIELGSYRNALEDFNQALDFDNHPEILALTAVAYAKWGEHDRALDIIRQLEVESGQTSGHSSRLAYVYLAIGRKNDALEMLETAYDGHEPDLRGLTYDRRWIPLWNEHRFRRLIERVGLPQL